MTIETADLYRSIKKRIEDNFENIPVQIKDKKNPHPPCFYIDFVSRIDSQTATEYENNSIIFDIVYFSEEQTLRDLTRKEKVLRRIFKKALEIELTENNVNTVQYQEIDSISFNFNEDDYILNCTLNISLDQYSDDFGTDDSDNDYTMEELNLKIE